MSHIIRKEDDILTISQLLEKFRSVGYKKSMIEEILNTIIPQNEDLPISIVFGNSSIPAFFKEEEQKIEVSLDVLKNYISKQIESYMKVYPNLEKEIFYNHILLALIHEVEHYYQCLVANEYVDFPYKIVVDGYKNIKDLKISKDLNPIIALIKIKQFFNYSHNADSLLERSANVEAYDLLVKVAKYENNTEMLKILDGLLSYQLSLGYKGFSNGSLEKTYRKKGLIDIYSSFNFDEIIPIEDKVRYGLPIDVETKKKVLSKQFKI